MTIYVDELPTLCCYCPFYFGNSQGAVCKLTGIMTKWDKTLGEMQSKCPLQSLADHDKQVKKKVCEEIKEKYKQKMANALDDDEETGHINCDAVLEELLEEIGFDEVLELYRSQGKWYA